METRGNKETVSIQWEQKKEFSHEGEGAIKKACVQETGTPSLVLEMQLNPLQIVL